MNEDKLLTLLQKKKTFFETILELTENEATLPLKELIHVLEQKTVLLTCIEEIDEALKPHQAGLYDLSQEIQEEIDTIKRIVETIMHLNTKNLETRKLQFNYERY